MPTGGTGEGWIKVPLLRTQEVLIVSWKAGERPRAGTIGSGVTWERATPTEVRDLVLWLSQASKPGRERGAARTHVGAVNPITGKPQGGSGYQPRTIRHNNAV